MQANILGTTLPVLEVDLMPGETIYSESGELSWMTSSIQMKTHTQAGGGGGFFGAFKRVVAGGSLFMTEYTPAGTPGSVSFAARVPGHIVPVDITPGNELMVHRHGFMCATTGVTLTIGFQQNLGAGIFGGDGFILQKVGGQGTAWLELSGELIKKDLAAGETLRVHPGHVGAFHTSVGFNITTVPGIKNALFGGDGIFLAALTGPGSVWLQTLPISRLAVALVPYLPKTGGESRGGSGGGAMIGGIVGSLLSGDN
jgi:uncharacterized protein (TIGR00266 family)